MDSKLNVFNYSKKGLTCSSLNALWECQLQKVSLEDADECEKGAAKRPSERGRDREGLQLR